MNTTAARLVQSLAEQGVRLWVDGGQLRFRAPQGVLDDSSRDAVRAVRKEIIAYLERGTPEVVADPEARHEPFPVTDVQSAYLLGRTGSFAYGGVACHGYGELTYRRIDEVRMVRAWQEVVRRHDMLRAVVDLAGTQRVLPDPPPLPVAISDRRGRPVEEYEAAVLRNRAELDHRVADPTRWPLVEVRLTLHDEATVVHASIDFLVADFVSVQVILDEVHRLYLEPEAELPALELTFRDYLAAERRWREAHHETARRYWLDRLPDLPPAPALPVLTSPPEPRFRRRAAVVSPENWRRLRDQARRHGVSPSTAVLTAYQEIIAAWSRSPAFTINVTLLNRLPLHPQVPALVGDFTSVSLLARDGVGATFADRARETQLRLWQDIDHRAFSGVEVMREITRRSGAGAAIFPIVFTSAIGLDTPSPPDAPTLGHGISQTPQVWIDCQNIERDGGLSTTWDAREGVLPDVLLDDAFAAYEDLLARLVDGSAWSAAYPVGLPAAQARRRAGVNATAGPVPAGLLHDGVVAQAIRHPDRTAVIDAARTMTYGELLVHANGVANALLGAGCRPGELVGITLGRSCHQVVAVLGTLLAGAVYVPVDPAHPPRRRAEIVARSGIRIVLTDAASAAGPTGTTAIVVATCAPAARPPEIPPTRPDELAYVIHTSGSTGVPKGVMISHRAALNTVADVNARFGVGPDDRVLGLSQLGFDLSVYDMFGPLSRGGCLIVPATDRRNDPSHLAALAAAHGVTIWNSVPAQMQMLVDYLTATPTPGLDNLRLVLLSGDWIPVPLPDAVRRHLPAARVVSLGGATEAAIWSIFHPVDQVDPAWPSIPYGQPLTNQSWYVLDQAMRPRPDLVVGELFIGGLGVADGYLDDADRTAERFPIHPETGQRLYRTGDLGRYLPNGDIEFLGREDHQVKIRGYRIEPAEVDTALATHPAVGRAVTIAVGEPPLGRRLVSFVEPAHHPEPTPAERTAVARPVADSARHAGAEALDGVDLGAYRRFTSALDRAALPGMVLALRRLGLFGAQDAVHTPDEIAAVTGPRRRLVRRWLRALTTEGYLAPAAGLRLVRPVDQSDADRAWQEVDRFTHPDDASLVGYFRASLDRLPDLLLDHAAARDLLFPEGRIDISRKLYEDAPFNRWANAAAAGAVRRIAAGRPAGSLRVLEVGAGAGGTTAAVLAALDGVEVDYLCTDLSPFFLAHSRERFAGHPGMRWATVDLNSPARDQGLSPNTFDLVVAGDVLHACTDIDSTLRSLAELLVPGGWLVALEMTRDHYQIMTSLELLLSPDNEAGDFTDARAATGGTFLDPGSWLRALAGAGGASRVSLPEGDEPAGTLGMGLFAARFKDHRAAATPDELTAHLAERLPAYLLPAAFQVLDTLPLTGNGKVDRAALRQLAPGPAVQGPAADATGSTTATSASDLERRLAAIWAAALGLSTVEPTANLFALGGDSLVSARIASQVQAEIPEAGDLYFDELLRELLERPTVRELARWVAAGRTAPVTPAAGSEPVTDEGSPVVPLRGRADDGPTLTVVHDCAGSLELWRTFAASADGAYVQGVDATTVRALDAGFGLDRLAAEQARAIAAVGPGTVRLVGYGYAALLALEIGRALADGGTIVDRVVIVGGRPARGAVGPAQMRAAFTEETGRAPSTDELSAFTALYTALAAHRPTLYAGDVTLVRSVDDDDADEFWADLCLDPAQVVEVASPRRDLPAAPETLAAALPDSGTRA
ncbi:non-ribosomal peptide synthetase [Micromonospora andamanensis]|uniref:Phenyloxazoline synthase MbtB n=1 Tax=Micromonospora andamanensis TaxID=1287068 RepID=A0ABQ4HTD2_9ACTN|nr:non-ribosomal peptide synthetase [Micromonospora andamanensis]GIJ08919.1 non-ribosomal peptide synthetase [Micromonospora andamanensis]